ncbi:hypothetical protein JW998_12310 [candidate division KSB1 bacterium]|nr:hypothetical protein [candidate division KSB1 bacterium]
MKKLFCLWAVFYFSTILSAASPYFQILEKSENRLVVEWSGPELGWRTVQVGARTCELPQLGSLPLTSTPGFPQLPLDAITFENGGQTLAVTVLDSVYEHLSAGRICPAATMLIDAEKTATHYREDALFEQDRFYPSRFLVSDQALFRGRPFVRLQVNPIKYNPVSGEIRLLRYLKIEVTTAGRSFKSFFSSPLDRELDKQILRLGRSEVMTDLRKPISSESPPRVKISLVDEGVYKVTAAALDALGVSLGEIVPQHIKVFQQDQQIACQVTGAEDGVFNSGDEVRFFAWRLAGENDYYFAHTDTNVYWLQWDAGAGLRYRSVESDEPGEFRYSLPAVRHFEQDREYYQGDSNSDIQNSHVVPGEGWVWDKAIDPGEKFRTTFDLPGYVVSQETATFTMRLRGQTLDAQPDAHHLRLFINGSLQLETFFDDRQELKPTLNIDGAILRESANVLEIESVSQGDRLSRFYFDWFRVNYEKNLTAASGYAFAGSAGAVDGGLWVNGFSSPDVSIWDIRNSLSIQPHSSGTSWVADCIVQSAGLTAGNFSRFYVNNRSVYEGTRGLSVVVLHPADGRVLLRKSFDTYGSPAHSDSLVTVLEGLADDTIIMAGIRDDGANNLTPAARAALGRFGSKTVAALQYRDSWAFIGRKGAVEPLAEEHKSAVEGSAEAETLLTFASGDSTINVQFAPSTDGEFVLYESAALKSPAKMQWRQHNPLAAITAADYVILSHEKFLEQAQRLADYRRSFNNYTTAVITVEDIYDYANHGIADPAAVQQFLKNAYLNWRPAPSYVLLFGDASWDEKGKLSSEFSNYVPSLGNPVSDALLVCFDGDDDFLPDLSIGRIPVKTRAEAQAAVDKIIEYENMPSARWKKRFLFISGGLDETEQRLFRQQSMKLADDFIRTTPTFGDAIFISKGTNEAAADERSLILDAINTGTLWTNFIGHAASRTWELMFNNPDIEELANKGRYPFISSMTCHTGRFGEPTQDSFGEAFLLAPQKGAIGFLGTSGWGYSYEDYLYLRQLYPKVLTDSLRCMGDIITLTKFDLWGRYGGGDHIQNLILQYNLLGDPALRLGLPLEPDLALESQDIKVNPSVPSEADSTAEIIVHMQNWGLAVQDSIDLLLEIEQQVTKKQLTQRLTAPPVVDSLICTWPLRDMAGPVEIRVTLDPDDKIKESDEGNNAQTTQVTVLTSTFAQVAPPNNARIPLDAVVLKIQTPQQYFEQEARYLFEIDTTAAFDSPAARQSPAIPVHPLLIKWRVDDLVAEHKYFWRARRQDREFDHAFLPSFYTSREPFFGWQQAHQSDAAHNVTINTEWGKGAELARKKITILLQSAWTNSVGYALIEIDNQTAMPTGRGLNVAVLNQNSGAIEKAGHFDTYGDVNASAELARFIETIATGRTVLAAVSDEGSINLTEAAIQALETIGSAKIRDLGYRDMWAIIGKKGAPRGSVAEGWESARPNGAVVLRDTLSMRHSRGRMLSERIGPATAWSSLSWDVTAGDSCDFYLNVLGYQKSSRDTVLLSEHIRGSNFDLAFLNADDYPYIVLDAHFSTSSASQSPLLKSWRAQFTPASDITIGRQLVTQSADTVLVGGAVTFYLDVYNIGLATAKNVSIVLQQVNQSGGIRLGEIAIDSIAVDRYAPIDFNWQAGSVPGEKRLAIIADPDNQLAELSKANNSVITSVYVHADTVKPDIRITFDDREIFDGDLVASEPLIVARLIDNDPELLADTTRIRVHLDGQILSFKNQQVLSLQESSEPDVQGELVIRPLLSDGEHILDLQLSDMSRNMIEKKVSFTVESDLALRNLLNYPNPLYKDTEFYFSLTRQALVRIKIYTVAGRLIRTIAPGVVDVGYNRIYWDGRDQEGDELANGVYLYHIIAENERESVTESSKVIIMR